MLLKPFVVVTLYLLPFVFRLCSDASVICRIRDLPHPPFAASAVCRIRDLPWLQAARLVMVMVVLKVKRLMFVA